eukprot:220851_1
MQTKPSFFCVATIFDDSYIHSNQKPTLHKNTINAFEYMLPSKLPITTCIYSPVNQSLFGINNISLYQLPLNTSNSAWKWQWKNTHIAQLSTVPRRICLIDNESKLWISQTETNVYESKSKTYCYVYSLEHKFNVRTKQLPKTIVTNALYQKRNNSIYVGIKGIGIHKYCVEKNEWMKIAFKCIIGQWNTSHSSAVKSVLWNKANNENILYLTRATSYGVIVDYFDERDNRSMWYRDKELSNKLNTDFKLCTSDFLHFLG